MGLIGGAIGGEAGGLAGQALGGIFGGKSGARAGGNIGRVAGGVMGKMFPVFKTGGKVGKTGLALIHRGEYVLPAGVAPTAAQKKAVAKRKAKK